MGYEKKTCKEKYAFARSPIKSVNILSLSLLLYYEKVNFWLPRNTRSCHQNTKCVTYSDQRFTTLVVDPQQYLNIGLETGEFRRSTQISKYPRARTIFFFVLQEDFRWFYFIIHLEIFTIFFWRRPRPGSPGLCAGGPNDTSPQTTTFPLSSAPNVSWRSPIQSCLSLVILRELVY